MTFWWVFALVFFIAYPIVYAIIRGTGRTNDWDFGYDLIITTGICWGLAFGLIVGRYFIS